MKRKKPSSSDLMQGDQEEEQKRMKILLSRKLNFFCWTSNTSSYSDDWNCWVKKTCSVHRSTWETAGIYEAIMNSTYVIQRHGELILELASRWCSETNTFAFPWGNATLILEDMSALGGFSASGVSALTSLDKDPDSRQIQERLDAARNEIIRSASRAALQGKWVKKFKESGSELEHAAFLTLWLSRHVFPSSTRSKVINKQVIPLAAMLSRGIKVALAPVVLASIYRDLGLLAKSFAQLLAHSDSLDSVNLCAPLHLVQIWAWERFPMLKPAPNYLVDKFPRLARWSNVTIRNEKDVKSTIDSAGKEFLWRPYGSSFRRHMEPIELTGLDSSVEKYQPQLVANQFGLDDHVLNVKVDNDSAQESSAMKLGSANDCVLPESTHQIDSGSDHECSRENKQALPPEVADENASDEVVCADGSCDDEEEDEVESVRSPHSYVASQLSNNETMGNAAGTIQDEIEGEEGRSSSIIGAQNSSRFDVKGYTNERFGGLGLGFDLEARISRLEDIVYANKGCRP